MEVYLDSVGLVIGARGETEVLALARVFEQLSIDGEWTFERRGEEAEFRIAYGSRLMRCSDMPDEVFQCPGPLGSSPG